MNLTSTLLKSLGLSLLLALAITAFISLDRRVVVSEPRTKDYPWMSSDDWNQAHQAILNLEFDEQLDLLLLGDSIFARWTQSSSWENYFGGFITANFSIGGDTVQNLLWRVEQGALDKTSAKLILLMIGTNNLSAGDDPPEAIAKSIEHLVQQVRIRRPEAQLLILGLIPRGLNPGERIRKRAKAINGRLRLLAKDPHLLFLDPSPVFLNPDRSLSQSLLPDSLHPSPMGYQHFSKYIAPKVRSILRAHPE